MLKSPSTQFAATLFFGPLGLAYSSVAAAVFLTMLLAVLIFTELGIFAIAIIWPISIIAGLLLVKMHNDGFRQSGRGLLLGPGEEAPLVSALRSWARGLAVLGLIAVGGFITFWYVQNSRSDIGRIVEDTDEPAESILASNTASNTDTQQAAIVIGAPDQSVDDNYVVTFDQQQIEPVVIDSSSQATSDSEDGIILYVTEEVVNLRKGPGTSNVILAQMVRGQRVSELGRDGAWVNVKDLSSGKDGWVFGRLIGPQQ